MASVALDLQPFRDTVVAPLPLFLNSERDNGPLFCCQIDATDATPRAFGLDKGSGGGISDRSNATLNATRRYQDPS